MLSYDLAPPPPPPPSPVKKIDRPGTHRKYEKKRQFANRREGRECGRSQIIRWHENLVFYKSFNIHCGTHNYNFFLQLHHCTYFMFILLGRLDLKRRFTDWPKQLIKQNISSQYKGNNKSNRNSGTLVQAQYTTAIQILIVLYKVFENVETNWFVSLP